MLHLPRKLQGQNRQTLRLRRKMQEQNHHMLRLPRKLQEQNHQCCGCRENCRNRIKCCTCHENCKDRITKQIFPTLILFRSATVQKDLCPAIGQWFVSSNHRLLKTRRLLCKLTNRTELPYLRGVASLKSPL